MNPNKKIVVSDNIDAEPLFECDVCDFNTNKESEAIEHQKQTGEKGTMHAIWVKRSPSTNDKYHGE